MLGIDEEPDIARGKLLHQPANHRRRRIFSVIQGK